MPAIIQGTVESILFARASSNAPALHGFAKSEAAEGWDGLPGWSEAAESPLFATCRRDGDRYGDENERR